MLLVLGYSHKDITQALKVLKWIGFLSHKAGRSMKRESLLLVTSRSAVRFRRHREILDLVARVFGEIHVHTPATEHEVGWPGACNHLFAEALLCVERSFPQDFLWLEADSEPTRPSWFDEIKRETELAHQEGKTFVGNIVRYDPVHLTGIAVYGKNWRKVCPDLVRVPDTQAWDAHCGSEVLPHSRITNLIQHIWKEPRINDISIVNPETAIFHQDKTGRLIELFDQHHYQGECNRTELFRYDYLAQPESPMPLKYYRAENSNRVIVQNGLRFAFEPYGQFAGTYLGTYITNKENEQVALDQLASNPRNAIYEISQEEWFSLTKKKITPQSPVSIPLNKISHPSWTVLKGNRAAVVVEEPRSVSSDFNGSAIIPPDQVLSPTKIESIDDVLEVGTVVPTETIDKTSMPPSPTARRPGRPSNAEKARRLAESLTPQTSGPIGNAVAKPGQGAA